MMGKPKSYAEITTPTNYQDNDDVVNDWPELKSQPKNQIKQKQPASSVPQLDASVNTLSNAMERLSTADVVQNTEVIREQKSRDDIRAERRIRRKNEKLRKKDERLEEKIVQIREPKSQKIQIVDRTVLDTYLTNRKLSPIRDRKQRKFKGCTAVKISLLDLINTKVARPTDRSSIQHRQTVKSTNSTQCHKGKKSEIQKKRYVSKLKRSILSSRLLRSQMKSELTSEPKDVDCDSKDAEVKNEETEIVNEKLISVNEVSNQPSSVQFSRKFRPYCDNLTSSELLSLTEALLRDIFRFQDRAYNKNEVKARSQRRYVVGFKESIRQLDIGKVKLLIIAPDLETGGDVIETIEEMKIKCQKSEIPYVFSLKRRQLGYVLLKKVPVSCVGILNYQGSEENSQKLIQLMQQERLRFQLSAGVSEVTNK